MTNALAFWRAFLEENAEIDPRSPYQVWYFGYTSESARDLAERVIAKKKTATSSLKAVNDIDTDKAPVAGGYSIVTDLHGEPLCIIQTTEIRHVPFNEVDARFAFDEGEGDQSLEDWRDGHSRFFQREAAERGCDFNERSLVCCERFKLLFARPRA